MSRSYVATLAVILTTGTIACTDATSPPAQPPATRTFSATANAQWAPIAQGVHTAVLPDLDNATVTALNDWDEVVGTYGTQAFHWQLTRGLTLLQLAGIHSSSAAGVNNTGQVAVTVTNDTITTVGLWSWDGSLRLLRLLSTFADTAFVSGAPTCIANAINTHNMVLGTCSIPALASSEPTTWTSSGRPYGFPVNQQLYGIRENSTRGKAISDDGYVVGDGNLTSLSGSPTGFIVSPQGTIAATIGVEPGAVNDKGWSAGSSTTTPFARAVLRDPNGNSHDLGTFGEATGLTDDNTVVGSATDSVGDQLYAFVWTTTKGLRRLPGLDANGADETSAAVAINHHHQIVGWIISHGARHSVMWTLPSPVR